MYSGKTVLITGSSRGIGEGLRKHFLYHGASVIGIAHKDYENGKYRCYGANLTSIDDITHAMGYIKNDYHKLDIVINNAATLTSNYFTRLTIDQMNDMVDVNILAPLIVTQESIKMMKCVDYGRIINISSMAVALEPMGDSVYAATKVALQKITNILAKEVSFMNITCNTLGVSAIETDMLRQLNKEKIDKVVSALPLPRYATIYDIVNVVDFFCSPKSNYITAQTIYLGGIHD